MTDIVLSPITSGYNLSKINGNFDKIEDSINNDVLHNIGGNNILHQDLDINGFDLLNVNTNPSNPNSLVTIATGDARWYNTSGDTLTGPMNVNGQTVTGLKAPTGATEAVRKAELDAFIAAQSVRDSDQDIANAAANTAQDLANANTNAAQDATTAANKAQSVRAPNGESITQLPPASSRANRVLGFDSLGNPSALLPASGSGTELALDLANTSDFSKGASLVGYKSALAGAVARNIRDVVDEFVSIRTFGGVGDLNSQTNVGTDNTAAFQAAAQTGRKIYLPPGNYRVNAKITTTAATSFYGDSPSSTRIYFYDCDGFDYNLTAGDWNRKVMFEGLAFCTTALGTRTGVSIVRSANTNKAIATQLSNVAFVGGDIFLDDNIGYVKEWLTAFYGKEVDSFSADNVYVRGNSQAGVNLFPIATRGIVLEDTTYVFCKSMMIFFQNMGFTMIGQCEGVRVESSDFVQCNYGYAVRTPLNPANHHVVMNNHFSCRTRGVDIPRYASLLSLNDHVISNNFFLKLVETGLGLAGYRAMSLGVGLSTISGNTFQSNPTGDYLASGDVGIYLDGGDNKVFGNTGYNCGTAVYIAPGVGGNIVFGNSMFAAGAGTGLMLNDASALTTNVAYGNTDNKNAVIGTFWTESQMQLGRPNGPVKSRFFDVSTSGNNILYDTRLEFLGGTTTQGEGEMRVRAGALNILAPATISLALRPSTTATHDLGISGSRWKSTYTNRVFFGVGGAYIESGTGSPEGVVTAPIGSRWMRTDGTAGTIEYEKQTGAGNTGWVAK